MELVLSQQPAGGGSYRDPEEPQPHGERVGGRAGSPGARLVA